jgi:putative membrane protein
MRKEFLHVTFSAGTHPLVKYESEDVPMMWGYGFGWSWLLMSLGMVLWIALLVVLVWAVIRWLDRRTAPAAPLYTSASPGGPSALEILNQRYARGEVDTATYEQMRERLEASGTRTYEHGDTSVPF